MLAQPRLTCRDAHKAAPESASGAALFLGVTEPVLDADVHSPRASAVHPRILLVSPREWPPARGLSLAIVVETAISSIDADIVRRAKDVMRLLLERKLSAITAESCTAGLISAALSEAEGASTGLQGAFVTYTKEQKTIALGVPAELLASHGSVNEEVARRMVEGALDRSAADVVLAVTGVLGPEPDEDGNPVGLVFLACCKRGHPSSVVERAFPRLETDRLRHEVVIAALDLMAEIVSSD
jgi:nicotinamide-nucleotide amidase